MKAWVIFRFVSFVLVRILVSYYYMDIKKVKKHLQKINWREIASILGLFTAWRLIIWLIAFIAKDQLSLNKDQAYNWANETIPPWLANIPTSLQYWARWDSGWYL